MVAGLAGHDCDLCNSTDGPGPGLGGEPDDGWPVRGRGRHRAAGTGARLKAKLNVVLTKLLRHDLAMLSSTVLVVAGLILNVFAVIYWTFMDDNGLGWLFSVSGSVLWLFACGIFCVFYPHPASRHAKRR